MLSLAHALQLSPELRVAAAEQAQKLVPVTDEMLLDPDPEDWLMMHRTYDFQAYSPLDQINRDNVGQLRLAWMRAMDPGQQEIRCRRSVTVSTHRPSWDVGCWRSHPVRAVLQLDAGSGRGHGGDRLVLPTPAPR